MLDWYHLTRQLTVLKKVLNGRDALDKIPRHHYQALRVGLKKLKWRLWHGQYIRAIRKLRQLQFTLRLQTVRDKEVARRLRLHATKLLKYLKNNNNSLPNYGQRYRAGERSATSFVESAVNEIIDSRMSRSRQMRWSQAGAHQLLQVRAAVVDGKLSESFEKWFPGFICREEVPLPTSSDPISLNGVAEGSRRACARDGRVAA